MDNIEIAIAAQANAVREAKRRHLPEGTIQSMIGRLLELKSIRGGMDKQEPIVQQEPENEYRRGTKNILKEIEDQAAAVREVRQCRLTSDTVRTLNIRLLELKRIHNDLLFYENYLDKASPRRIEEQIQKESLLLMGVQERLGRLLAARRRYRPQHVWDDDGDYSYALPRSQNYPQDFNECTDRTPRND